MCAFTKAKQNMEAVIQQSLQNEYLLKSLLRRPHKPTLKHSHSSSFADAPREELVKALEPIRKQMEHLDAVLLLQLECCQDGAVVSETGTTVHPIHDEIRPPRSDTAVRYLHLTEVADLYSIGIFVFPPHARIPLHDHPGMCVLSRILYGTVTRLSMDVPRKAAATTTTQQRSSSSGGGSSWWNTLSSTSSRLNNNQPRTIVAHHKRVEVLQAPTTTVLFPHEGNLHEFVAGPHGAAVLDVLLPPYDDDHRDCTFYQTTEDDQDHHACTLVPIPQPDDFHCVTGEYPKWMEIVR